MEPEAKHDVVKTLRQIREAGCRAGLTLNPETPFETIEPFFGKFDLLLVMTVHPGFGGQPFRDDQMEKVRRAAKWNHSREHKIDIEVDGGINPKTARISVENGANVLVAGTSIFRSNDYAKAIRELRGERIDIIEWSEDPAVFAANALSPAKVSKVEINSFEDKRLTITVADDQLSLAIGKNGQNVRLAAKLTGWKIDVRSPKEKLDSEAAEKEEAVPAKDAGKEEE